MGNPRSTVLNVSVDLSQTTPRLNAEHDDGTISIALTPLLDFDHVYVNGTLDQLAKLVYDLASIVGELSEREMATITTDPLPDSTWRERQVATISQAAGRRAMP